MEFLRSYHYTIISYGESPSKETAISYNEVHYRYGERVLSIEVVRRDRPFPFLLNKRPVVASGSGSE